MGKRQVLIGIDEGEFFEKLKGRMLLKFIVKVEESIKILYEKMIDDLEFESRVKGLGEKHIIHRQIYGVKERLEYLSKAPKGFDDDYDEFDGEKYSEEELHPEDRLEDVVRGTNPFMWGQAGEGNN